MPVKFLQMCSFFGGNKRKSDILAAKEWYSYIALEKEKQFNKRHRKFATPIIPAVLNKDKFTTFGGGR